MGVNRGRDQCPGLRTQPVEPKQLLHLAQQCGLFRVLGGVALALVVRARHAAAARQHTTLGAKRTVFRWVVITAMPAPILRAGIDLDCSG